MPSLIRELVAQQAGYCCEYCLSPADYCPDPYSIEHIEPRSVGGSNNPENLAFSCQGCNSRKFVATQAPDPVTGELVELFHPRQDSWQDHFAWQADFTLIVGTSPRGRATIERLQLNRDAVVNLRRILRLSGILPRR